MNCNMNSFNRRKLALALLTFALLTSPAASNSAWAQQGPALVVTAEVVEREISSGQTFIGTVVPFKTSVVGSAVDGRVIDYPIEEGSPVAKGETLAQLLTETIELELAAAQAELRLREQELAELKNGSRPEEVEVAKSRMLGAKSLKEVSASKFKRLKTLYETGRAVTEDELEVAIAESIRTEQLYIGAEAQYELAVQGPRAEKIAQAEARRARQAAEVSQIQDQIKKYTIRAPFDGYVTAEHTEVGQWVSRGELVAEVVAVKEVDIVVSVLDSQIPHMQLGMPARVEIPALAAGIFTGKIAIINPQGDQLSRTFPVKVRLQNQFSEHGPLVKPGMLTRVTLPTGPKQNALIVPKDALVLGGPKTIVYVVDPQPDKPTIGKVRPVPVELGVASDSLIQVIGPLEPGNVVVIEGNERLRPGMEVLAKEKTPEQQPAKE